jgi:hypothetical protein
MESFAVKLADYTPAVSPTLDQQRDALQKGLGRAVQWAMAGRLDEGTLLDACLHDWRFDGSVDEYRGDWLWQLVQAVHAEDRFRESVFEALNNLVENDAAQLCQLGFHYALTGDDTFRARLYKIVEEKPFAEMRYLGEEEIIRIDGEEAFLFAARLRGRQLEHREWEWDDSVLIDGAGKHLGKDRVENVLQVASDEGAKRFRNAWLRAKSAEEASEESRESYADRMKQIPVADIIAAAESPETKYSYFRRWGRWASNQDLEAVLEHLLSSPEPKVIANYLEVFSWREFPRVLPELISLSQHHDPEVRRRAIGALENNSHPLVRQLAEAELQKGVPGGLALGLFVKNYQDGDEQRIIEFAQLPEDSEQQHWLLKDATKILEENPNADCSQLGVAVYALIPCAFCRHFAAKVLRDRQVAPSWLIEECRFDSEPDTRNLFATP